MIDLMQIIAGWDTSIQVGFLAGVVFFSFLLLATLLRTVRVVLSGYPPSPDVARRQSCTHLENIRGECLNVIGCKTKEECNRSIEAHDE